MADRYTRLFALPSNLYTEGSPLLVAAGALLKDTVTGKVLAQLKFTSLCEKTIKAVKVCVTPFDTVGRPLGEAVPFTYLDLSVTRDNDFGQKIPIPLAESEARSFAVTVEEIAFADNSLWTSPAGAVWEPLPAPQSAGAVLQDRELAKQYALKFGQNHTLWPQRIKDLWRCSCGALNRIAEKTCHRCQWTIENLDIDTEALKAEAAARLEQERIAAQKAAEEARLAKEKAEAEARRAAEQAAIAAAAAQKARKKRITIFAAAAVVIASAAAAWLFVLQPMLLYRQVMADMESGEYDAAITALETRPDTDEKVQAYLAYAKTAKALADNDFDTAETELDKFAGYAPLQEQYAQMTAVHAQILFDGFFAAIQAGDSSAKEYWDKANAAGSFTPEQCYQVAQWIVSESHADSRDKIEKYHKWVNILLAGQETTAEAAALLEQNDLQYVKRIIAPIMAITEDSYYELKEVISKYNSEQAQQLGVKLDALWEREQKYQAAYAILTSQTRDADYGAAKQMFEELGNYRDAKTRTKDAQNLMSMAKFLGTYHNKYTATFYLADGSVLYQDTDECQSVISYSLVNHCLAFDEHKLTVDGNNLSYSSMNGNSKSTGRMDGDYIYITSTYNLSNDSGDTLVTNSTLQRIR